MNEWSLCSAIICFTSITGKKEGRFDVFVEDDDEVLVGASGVAQTQV